MNRIPDNCCVAALIRGGEHWIVMYPEGRKKDALRQLGQWAANDQLGFSWHDAAVLSKHIRTGEATA